MQQYDVIIIGAGLGGLGCGYALAKQGLNVCILEQGTEIGGAFQVFRRAGHHFDTGFHYVGGVGKGEMMHPLVAYFNLEGLPWHRLDDDCFEEVIYQGQSYRFSHDYDRFIETLVEQFPDDRRGITALVDVFRGISDHLYDSLRPDWDIFSTESFTTSAYRFFNEQMKSPVLRQVIVGGCVKSELTEKLPLYAFSQSINSFIQGSYRLQGGGGTLVHHIADQFRAMGGTLVTRARVTELVERQGRIAEVITADGNVYTARTIVSNAHPATTLALIKESSMIRNIYRRRINNLVNSYGMFTTQLMLKPHTVKYRNRGIYIHEMPDIWHADYGKGSPTESLFINFACPPASAEGYATTVDLLTPMLWEQVAEWSDSRIGHRPEGYKEFKQRKAEEAIQLAVRYIPELAGNIEKVYTSSPLTYRDYTGTVQGSAYGIRKDCDALMQTILTPKSPIPNLFFTGQNLTLHGMLGVLMASIQTAGYVVGDELKLIN